MLSFNIIPSFPEYTGPFAVGSCDAELPVADLTAPSPAPEGSDIATVSFRIFYPCEPTTKSRPIRWLPGPQKASLAAYAKFLGANNLVAEGISLFPHLLYYTTIPALRNAPLLKPTTRAGRWPVMVFSHGLGGSRNAYSHICGTLASHGLIVIAPDHRDRSAPVSYIRATSKTPAKILDYKRYSHTPSPEVYAGRDEQLKIRLWELGLIHDAMLRMDLGQTLDNLDPNCTTWRKKDKNDVLKMFNGVMDVHRPGAIIWAGHSFGACTTTQLLKSTYWGPARGEKAVNNPLFSPGADSSLSKQITPDSPAILLDMWCLPLQSPQTRELWEKPMPGFAPNGPGGRGILAILSEAFFKWQDNLSAMSMALTSNIPGDSRPGPRFFYPTTSAHLSQSDFGILFGWLIKRVLKTEQPPERYIKLNARAILEVLRENNYEVAETSAFDREEETEEAKTVPDGGVKKTGDWRILDVDGNIPGWKAINLDRLTGDGGQPVRGRSPANETEVLGEVAA
ncbi:uncharacterized protein PV09_00875 [Verruconis gallopava]|uniref:Putative phospholipase n=1 Tax=Verruconis gallopava TaxID=253628 RepID=A0A0D2BC84_9PEZI|nr:uncharacterized protein PV09_00875 [Verruconis gallopava]KIW08964.1 hypothetical protein PV09_00875 [Verruconis gallopava]